VASKNPININQSYIHI